MLDEKVNERYKSCEERATKDFSKIYGSWIRRAEGETANCPWDGGYQVRNHEDIVPVMIVCGCNIRPPSTSQGPEDTDTSDKFGQDRARSGSHGIPKCYQQKAWPWSSASVTVSTYVLDSLLTRCDCNENLEYGSFRVAISDSRRDRRKPFDWVALSMKRQGGS